VTTDGTPPAAAEHLANADAPQERPTFDTSVAHIARVYDYWLGSCFL
jgi:S-adenosyl methyltransferase